MVSNTLIFLDFLCREQPPPRGCVLKLTLPIFLSSRPRQPPPRGCVLKRKSCGRNSKFIYAAASARLCVETQSPSKSVIES